MFACCECCVFSGTSLCNELITRPEKSYRPWCVVVCDLENLVNEGVMARVGSQRPPPPTKSYQFKALKITKSATRLTIKVRILCVKYIYMSLFTHNVFRPQKKNLKKTRIKLYNTLALPGLLYGRETWTIKARDPRRITAAEMKHMRRTAGYTWTDYNTNTQIERN